MKRLPVATQEAVKQLACLGNVADVATLTLVYEETEEAVHAALWEAVYAGLILRQKSAYTFLHDRIQQAAYSLIPEDRRADVHLRIGRLMLASMTPDQLAEHLFDVASQFNRAAGLLIDRDEKAQVTTIDLRAGRRAKASAAYASACVYLAAGMALLDETDWSSRYGLTFGLWLERAECEFLSGNFEKSRATDCGVATARGVETRSGAGALSRWLRTCDLLGGPIARWMKNIDYDGYRFPPAIIQQAIWLYFRFTFSRR
jgi:predicted ATPase